MGWLFTERPYGQSVRAFFEKRFNSETDHAKWEILDCSATFRVAYMAVRITKKETGKTYVVGIVCLIRHDPKARDGYNFGYKDMDECMGPNESECPRRILDLLSPIEEICEPGTSGFESATAWRARCLAHHELARKSKNLKNGTKIEFKDSIRFVDGYEGKTFRIDRQKRRRGTKTRFRSTDNGGLYCISRWRARPFEVHA